MEYNEKYLGKTIITPNKEKHKVIGGVTHLGFSFYITSRGATARTLQSLIGEFVLDFFDKLELENKAYCDKASDCQLCEEKELYEIF